MIWLLWLQEYAQFVEISRQYAERGKDIADSLEQAIDFCIKKNILGKVLSEYRAEVLGMLLEEFDAKKYEKAIREDEHDIAFAAGREEGIKSFIIAGVAAGFGEKYIKDSLQKYFSLDTAKAEDLYQKYVGKNTF